VCSAPSSPAIFSIVGNWGGGACVDGHRRLVDSRKLLAMAAADDEGSLSLSLKHMAIPMDRVKLYLTQRQLREPKAGLGVQQREYLLPHHNIVQLGD
jgi:hypothetical protein